MTQNAPTKIRQALQQNTGKIKVWSLVVSVFGDLAGAKDKKLSGTFLNSLFTQMGYRPEALRVALHRLRKDGWIISEKSGRTGLYSLSKSGLKETQRATPLIYDTRAIENPELYLCVLRDKEHEIPHDWVKISARTYICAEPPESQFPDILISKLNQNQFPKWVGEEILSEESKILASTLLEQLKGLENLGQPTLMESLAIRALILHQWRRLVLRNSCWLHLAIEPDGLIGKCQASAHAAFERFDASIPENYEC